MTNAEWITTIVQGGSLALLSVVLLYTGPRILKALNDERREERAASQQTIEKINAGFEERNAALCRSIDRFTKAIDRMTASGWRRRSPAGPDGPGPAAK